MTDLWTEAGRDAEQEALEARLTTARLAASSLWPFLAAAESLVDYENRVALMEDRIARIAATQTGNDPVLFGVVHSSLHESFAEDFRVLHTARMQKRADRVSDLNEVIRSGGTQQVEGHPIDLNTAAMILRVYNAADDAQRSTLDSVTIHELIRLAWEHNASRKVAEEGGQTCSVCGDKIAANPEGDGYHHDNGEKHDHEAKAGGSKESAKTAADRPGWFEPYDQMGRSGSGAPYFVVNDSDGSIAAGPFDTRAEAENAITQDLQQGVKAWWDVPGAEKYRTASRRTATAYDVLLRERGHDYGVVDKTLRVDAPDPWSAQKQVEDTLSDEDVEKYEIVGTNLVTASRRTAGENPFAKKDEDEKKPEEKAVDAVEEAKEDEQEAPPAEDPAAPAPEVPAPADPAAQTPAATQENGAAAVQPMLDAGYEPQTKGGKTLEEALAAGEPIQFLPPAAPAATTPVEQAPAPVQAARKQAEGLIPGATLDTDLEMRAQDLARSSSAAKIEALLTSARGDERLVYERALVIAKDRASRTAGAEDGKAKQWGSAPDSGPGWYIIGEDGDPADGPFDSEEEAESNLEREGDRVYHLASLTRPFTARRSRRPFVREAVVQWTDEGGDAWTASGGSGAARIEKVDGEFHWETDGDSGESSTLNEAKSQAESKIASRRVAADLPEVGSRVKAKQPGGDSEVEGTFEGLDERGLAKVRYSQGGFNDGSREYVGRFSPANVRTAANPYEPTSNPYISDPPNQPGIPDDSLDGPANNPLTDVASPVTTKPRQTPSGAAADYSTAEPARPAQEKVTQGFASLASTPVICRRCGSRGRVAKVTADLSCKTCGTGDDLDYDDTPSTTASLTVTANPFGDPDMGARLLPQGTPDQDADVAPVREGDQKARKVTVPKGSPVYTQQALGTPGARRAAKVEQIAQAVLSTNPGMPREAAVKVAKQTLNRYPKMLVENEG